MTQSVLFLQKTRIQFPAPTAGGPQSPATPSLGKPNASGPQGYLHSHTFPHTCIHITENNKDNPFLRKKTNQSWWCTSLIPTVGSLWVWGQPGLQSEFQDSQSYTEKTCLKKNARKKENKKKKGRKKINETGLNLLGSNNLLVSIETRATGSHQHLLVNYYYYYYYLVLVFLRQGFSM